MDAEEARRRETPDAHWIIYAFHPWDEYTQAEVRLESRCSGVGSSLVVWSGHLAVGRRDLTGKSPRDVSIMLGDELWRHLHDGYPNTDSQPPAVGPGAPLGATGGTVPQDTLPGL